MKEKILGMPMKNKIFHKNIILFMIFSYAIIMSFYFWFLKKFRNINVFGDNNADLNASSS